MGERQREAAGRFRDTGLFLLCSAAWLIIIVVASRLLIDETFYTLDFSVAQLISAGMELMLFAPAAVYMIVKRIRVSELFGRATAGQVISAAFMGMLLVPVSLAVTLVNFALITLTGGQEPPAQGFPPPDTLPQYLTMFFAIGVVAPLVEEPVFRGLVLRGQRGVVHGAFIVAITGASFTLMHGQLIGLPGILIGGVVMSVLAIRSGSIWPSVAMHAAYNSTILLQIVVATRMEKLMGTAGAMFVPPFPQAPQVDFSLFLGLSMAVVVWCLFALPFALAIAAILFGFWRYTPHTPAPLLRPAARLGFGQIWPWVAAFLLLIGYVAIDLLQLYGIIRA